MNTADIVITDIEVLNKGKKKSRPISYCTHRLFCKHPALLFLQNTIGPTACITLKREDLQLFNPELKWFVDIEWYYRLLKGKRVSHCKACKIQSLDGHEEQISKKLDIMQAFIQDKAIISNIHGSDVRLMLWLHEHLILGTKRLLGQI